MGEEPLYENLESANPELETRNAQTPESNLIRISRYEKYSG
jgi:hypothetical protein